MYYVDDALVKKEFRWFVIHAFEEPAYSHLFLFQTCSYQ